MGAVGVFASFARIGAYKPSMVFGTFSHISINFYENISENVTIQQFLGKKHYQVPTVSNFFRELDFHL